MHLENPIIVGLTQLFSFLECDVNALTAHQVRAPDRSDWWLLCSITDIIWCSLCMNLVFRKTRCLIYSAAIRRRCFSRCTSCFNTITLDKQHVRLDKNLQNTIETSPGCRRWAGRVQTEEDGVTDHNKTNYVFFQTSSHHLFGSRSHSTWEKVSGCVLCAHISYKSEPRWRWAAGVLGHELRCYMAITSSSTTP